jgi:hypothetical protein
MDLHNGSLLKQLSPGRHVTPLGHIILNPSQPVFALTPKCCMLSGEATNTNVIVFGLSGQRLGPTVYCTRSEDAIHYIIDTCTSIMNEIYYYFEISSLPPTPNEKNIKVRVHLICLLYISSSSIAVIVEICAVLWGHQQSTYYLYLYLYFR